MKIKYLVCLNILLTRSKHRPKISKFAVYIQTPKFHIVENLVSGFLVFLHWILEGEKVLVFISRIYSSLNRKFDINIIIFA